MKRFTMATVLACILSVSAMAGAIPCDLTSPEPDTTQTTSTTTPGEIPTAGVTGEIPSGGIARQAEEALLDGFLAVVGWLT